MVKEDTGTSWRLIMLLVVVVVDFRLLSRSRHVSWCLRDTSSGEWPFLQHDQHGSRMGPCPRSHQSRATRQILNPVGIAQLFGGFSLRSKEPLWGCFSLHDEDLPRGFRFHSSDRSATRSPWISKSVTYHDLSPHPRRCIAHAVETTLQLSERL